MSTPFIPPTDAGALAWMKQFALVITNNPGVYGLTAADATAITNAVNAFEVALDVTNDDNTRTKITVAAKDDARTSAEQICRQYAKSIKADAGVSDPDKLAAGIPPENTNRNPVPPPTSSPFINVVASTPGAQTLRYVDSMTPEITAKPFGVIQLQLFVAVGDVAEVNPDNAKYHGSFTKNPIGVAFTAADSGKYATYFGRWINRKGEVGPWSNPASMRIAA